MSTIERFVLSNLVVLPLAFHQILPWGCQYICRKRKQRSENDVKSANYLHELRYTKIVSIWQCLLYMEFAYSLGLTLLKDLRIDFYKLTYVILIRKNQQVPGLSGGDLNNATNLSGLTEDLRTYESKRPGFYYFCVRQFM